MNNANIAGGSLTAFDSALFSLSPSDTLFAMRTPRRFCGLPGSLKSAVSSCVHNFSPGSFNPALPILCVKC